MGTLLIRVCAIACVLGISDANILNSLSSVSDSKGVGALVSGAVSTAGLSTDINAMSDTASVAVKIKKLGETLEDIKEKLEDTAQCKCDTTPAITTKNAKSISNLTAAVEKLQKTCTRQKSTVDGMMDSVADITNDAGDQDYSNQLNDVRNNIKALNKSIKSVVETINTTMSKAAKMEDFNKMKATLKQITGRINNISPDVDSCASQCSSAAEATKNVVTNRERDMVRKNIQELEDKVGSIGGDTAADGLKTEFKKLKDSLGQLRNVTVMVKKRYDAVLVNITAVQRKAQTAKKDMSDLTEKVEKSLEVNKRIKHSIEKAIDEMKSAGTTADAGGSNKKKLADIKARLQELKKQMEVAKRSDNKDDGNVAALKTKFQKLYQILLNLRDSNKDNKDKVDRMQEYFKAIKEAVDELNVSKIVDDWKKYVADLNKAVNDRMKKEKASEPVCPKPFDREQGYCIYKNYGRQTWLNAYYHCQYIGGSKARLLTLESEEKRSALSKSILKGDKKYYFVGLFVAEPWEKDVRKRYYWMGGKPVANAKWYRGYPFKSQCGLLWNHHLAHASCYHQGFSICEIPM